MNTQGGLTRDTQIAEAVQQALKADKITAPYVIDVAVQGTSATLTGNVGDQEARDRATHVAKSVDGVIEVTNGLEIHDDNGGGLFGLGKRNADDENVTPVPFVAGGGFSSGSGGGTGYPGGAPIGFVTTERDDNATTEGKDSTGE